VRAIAPAPVLSNLSAIPYVPGDGPTTPTISARSIVDVPILDGDGLGCSVFGGGLLSGQIEFIERGTCYFRDKVSNAAAAGATAVIVLNNVTGAGAVGMSGLGSTTRQQVCIPPLILSNPRR